MRGLYFFLAALISSGHSYAATFSALDIGDRAKLIVLSGPIERGDYENFLDISAGSSVAGILLRSEGGNALEGIKIGREIHRKGYATGVAPKFLCTSACALIWVAGSTRYMAADALIGFHAAYISEATGKREVGWGNALVGAYLNGLGLSDEAIHFATKADPNDMEWLSISSARRVGISVVLLDDHGNAFRSPNERTNRELLPLKLPPGFRWIVLASGNTARQLPYLRALRNFKKQSLIAVRTSNGKYALAAGPFSQVDADTILADMKRSRAIPSDAYLSSGNGFVTISSN